VNLDGHLIFDERDGVVDVHTTACHACGNPFGWVEPVTVTRPVSLVTDRSTVDDQMARLRTCGHACATELEHINPLVIKASQP
jgi:hypothetical protein